MQFKQSIAKIFLGILFLFLVFLLHIGFGSAIDYSPLQVLGAILRGQANGTGSTAQFVVWQLRLPRAFGCVLAGALLGGAGSVFQALFRNPLADPYIMGTASGAAIGGVLATIAGWSVLYWGLAVPFCAFIGGMVSLGIVLALSSRAGKVEPNIMLLSGVLVGSVLSGLLSLAMEVSGQKQQILNWLLGAVDPMSWPKILMMSGVLLVCTVPLLLESRRLNAFALGEAVAARLGVDTVRLRNMILLLGTAMTAAAVGSTGIIAFVGLIAPNAARKWLGVDWRISFLGSMIAGAATLLLADAISQRILNDGLPVGIITSVLGAPILVVLLRSRSKKSI